MKKKLSTVLFIFVLLLSMSGCSAAKTIHELDRMEDKVEAKLDAAEDKLENRIETAIAPAPGSTANKQNAAAKGQTLSQEQALQIALDYLGFSAEDVGLLYAEYEIDDGVSQYDVKFIEGDWEHEFEIHAESGNIISYEKDHKYD